MKSVTRDDIKSLYQKVKHLRLPSDLETVDFAPLSFYGWLDESDDIYYLIAEIEGQTHALRGEIISMPSRVMMKHSCTICRHEREFNEVMLFSVKSKRLPKGVDYRVEGIYMCKDYRECNKSMKDSSELQAFIRRSNYRK